MFQTVTGNKNLKKVVAIFMFFAFLFQSLALCLPTEAEASVTGVGYNGNYQTSLGDTANSSIGLHSFAAGYNVSAAGNYAVAMGSNASAAAENSFALGGTVAAGATNGVAIGNGSSVTGSNSVALGAGSIASEAYEVSVGSSSQTRKISNVTAVTLAENGTYAATTGQLYTETRMPEAGKYYGKGERITAAIGNVDTQVKLNADAISAIHGSEAMNSTITKDKVDKYETYVTGEGLNASDKVISNVRPEVLKNGGKNAATTGQVYEEQEARKEAVTGATLSAVTLGADKHTLTVSENSTDVQVDLAALETTQGNTLASYFTDGVANSATKDANGNVISTTYAKVADVDTRTAVKINSVSGDNINTGSGIVLKQGSNIEITNSGNVITITSVGGADTDAVHYEKSGSTKTNNIVLEGQNAGDKVTIKNVAAGDITSASSTDAVNGGQLYATNQNVAALQGNFESDGTTAKAATKATQDGAGNTITATYATKSETDAATSVKINSGSNINTGSGIVLKQGSNIEITNNGNEITITSVDGTTAGGDKPEGAKDAEAKGEGAVAMGYDSQAIADGATAVGYGNRATGEKSTAVGYGNVVTGTGSGAFGDPNVVTATGSYAIGNDNTITGDNTFVLGNNVKTSAKNAVVLGNNSTATRDNTVSVGAPGAERQITNVAAGTMGTDAANMNQLWGVEKESREIAAMSGALAGLHYLEPSGEGDDRVTGAVAYGGYRGENAAAVGVAYKPNPDLMFSASTSVGNSQNIYNAGVSVRFGKGKTVNRAEMAKQIKYLGEENNKLKEENAQIKETLKTVLERLEKLEKKQ